jgi:uncharacterized protein (TIGR02118 family)
MGAASLLALYRRPDGGDAALETFLQRYRDEHLPLIATVPGLRSTRVRRVTHAYGDSDLVLVAELAFDDRAALDAAVASEEMRAAGRNLRDIAPGLATLVVVEDDQ